MVVAFVVLQLLDIVFTIIGVKTYGTEFEGNHIATSLFVEVGLISGCLILKSVSFFSFFGLLYYCLHLRWSFSDLFRLILRKELVRRNELYVMRIFYGFGVFTIVVSLYLSLGWIYILVYMGIIS